MANAGTRNATLSAHWLLRFASNGLVYLLFVIFISYAFAWRDFTIRYMNRDLYRNGLARPLFSDPDDYVVRD
jgi:hypothetical protein